MLLTRASLTVCRGSAVPTSLRRPCRATAPSHSHSARRAPRLSSRRLHSARPTALFETLFGGKGEMEGGKGEMEVTNEHFVLKNAIKGPFPAGIKTAVFGTGCFWGTEKGFWRLPGVYSTAVGYCGGNVENPTYQQVCSGRSGHNEVVMVAYDESKVSYADLLRMVWESHDPTQGMGQGNDRGTQYRSGIYYYDEDQKKLALASKEAYQANLMMSSFPAITTEIIEAPTFFYAEDYHQQYLAKPGSRLYCSAMPTAVSLGNDWVPADMAAKHKPRVPDAAWVINGPKQACSAAHGPNTTWAL